MIISRYMKKFDSWMACAYKADEGTAGYEFPHERGVIYQYVYYGSAKIAKPFSDDVTIIKANGKLIDVKKKENELIEKSQKKQNTSIARPNISKNSRFSK